MTEIDGIAIIADFDGLANWWNFDKFGYPPKKRLEPEIDEFDEILKSTKSMELQ